ncbi:2OG-Fe dioxygenase family protein [Paenibacillus oenotherae]|nr:2OG-Fe dioxygenase family protein [Paenibacillus oenotherae]
MTLTNPLDILIADDNKTMHGVTPVQVDKNGEQGYRDVLVVAFTKEQ